MKIAAKPLFYASLAAIMLLRPAAAETTVLDMANKVNAEAAAATANPQMPAITPPAMPISATTAPVSATAAASTVTLDNPTGTVNDKEVPPQVQAVVDKLRGAKVDLSLEDMNQARAALARLDLLLELEQKMHDLQEARQKHENAVGGSDISSLLPTQVASMGGRRGMTPQALPIGLPVTPAEPPTARPVRPKPSAAQYEVQRIQGVNGSYSVLLKSLIDAKISTVRMGETLSDGLEVMSISPSSVKLRDPDNGRTQTLTVENVSAISGGRGAH